MTLACWCWVGSFSGGRTFIGDVLVVFPFSAFETES